jgi:DNA-binding transcriptional regulator YiaG
MRYVVGMNGNDLKGIRQANRLSQEQFGELLGVHRTSVSDWERGTAPVPVYAELFALLIERRPELLPELERLRGMRK